MSDAYFLAGLPANACINALSVTPSSSHALSDFDESNLQNGKPWLPFIMGASATDAEIAFDLSMVEEGDFEGGTDGQPPPDPWVTQSGTPTVSTTEANDGTKSLRLNATLEASYVDVLAIAGKRYRLEFALFGDGTNTVRCLVYDIKRGRWKTSASETSWQDSATVLQTRTAASWQEYQFNIVMESQAIGGSGQSTLRIIFEKLLGTGAAYVDSVFFYPEVDFASIHGHNLNDAIDIEIHSSTDNFSASDDTEATLPTQAHRTYSKFTPSASDPRRYWKFLFSGTNRGQPIRVGQTVLGEATLWNPPLYSTQMRRFMPQAGLDTDLLRLPQNLSDDARYRFDMDFRHTEADFRMAVEQILKQSAYGVEPIVIVPDTGQPEQVLHGRAPNEQPFTRFRPTSYEHGFTIWEDPFWIPSK